MQNAQIKNTPDTVLPVKRISGFIALFSAIALTLSACGGGADSESRPTSNSDENPPAYAGSYAGTDVKAFKQEVWDKLSPSSVCGRCHRPGADNPQTPYFVDWLDVNNAYRAVIPDKPDLPILADLANPASSRLVQKVASGHNCWLGSNSQCADAMTSYIEAWANGSVRGETEVSEQLRDKLANLPDPPQESVRFFLGDTPPAAFGAFYDLVTNKDQAQKANCVSCHRSGIQGAISPYFADPDPVKAYSAARTIIDLNTPEKSNPYVRVSGGHNCWTNSCTNDANYILGLIIDMQTEVKNSSPAPLFPKEQISTRMLMNTGVPISSGNRYEAHQIALYEFKDASLYGIETRTIADTSGVEPATNLTIYGNGHEWLASWGIRFNGTTSYAQADVATSRKLHDLIKLSGEYSIEAWVVPANTTQVDKSIIEYSASIGSNNIDRNFALGQTQYSYDFYSRNSTLGNNDGGPVLNTDPVDQDLQSSLQHVVVTYDQNNGRRIYVNGEFTDDVDDQNAGNLLNWSSEFHVLSFGSAPSGVNKWAGDLRMVSIHDRALNEDQIRQNYAAEVGLKYLLPFNVDQLLNNGTKDNYIVFEVNRYDDYSYLFRNPRFINVDSDNPTYIPASSTALRGLHIGINGQRVLAGQAYDKISIDNIAEGYTPENGLLLSNIDTIIQIENQDNANPPQPTDVFFLITEQLGSFNFASVNPDVRLDVANQDTVPPLPDVLDNDRLAAIGLRTFDEINATMSQMTGISDWQNVGGDTGINTVFNTYRRQFPSTENIETFSSSNQMAVAQLAMSYCNELVTRDSQETNEANRYFAGFNYSAVDQAAVSAAFAGNNINLVIDPLLVKMLNAAILNGDDATENLQSQPPTYLVSGESVKGELNLLINGGTDINGLTRTGLTTAACPQPGGITGCTLRVKQIVTAACTSVLGSAVMLVQ